MLALHICYLQVLFDNVSAQFLHEEKEVKTKLWSSKENHNQKEREIVDKVKVSMI